MNHQAIVRIAKTKGGRYVMAIFKLADDNYIVEQFARGRSSWTSCGHSRESAEATFDRMIEFARDLDGIKYLEGGKA
jgi:hypothetical protein